MLALGAPREALACSITATRAEIVRNAERIVVGQVTAMELVEFTGFMRFIRVRLTFDVDRYLKGSGPDTLVLYDDRSVEPGPNRARTSVELAALTIDEVDLNSLQFNGSSGACGTLNADPVGQYWVTLVGEAGQLGIPNWPWGIGTGPDDRAIVEATQRVEAALQEAGIEPGSTGMAGTANNGRDRSAVETLALLVCASALVLVGRLATGGGHSSGGHRPPHPDA